MTSEELAEYVERFARQCARRVMTSGAQQYVTATGQYFETMDLDALLDWTREEVHDVGVYAAMLDIRLNRLESALREVRRRADTNPPT